MCCSGQPLALLILRLTIIIDLPIVLVRSTPIVQRPNHSAYPDDSPSARVIVVQPAQDVEDDE